ncbi:MAG: hypothetical protein KBS76_05620 [Ruminococcus sp.]|nr:hypothetical protein [Candidatus Apopatosoma intestinale]
MNFTYEKDYASRRDDGRTVESLASWTAFLRRTKPLLSTPESLTADSFFAWKAKVKETLGALLALPEVEGQPAPVCLSSERRDGYRTEKWEFYPYETAAVPVLMQIPDGATAETPAPLVFCFPGSIHNKEFVAGEPLLPKPAARFEKFPERNRMGQIMAKNGMVSVTFDPISIGEAAFWAEPGDHGVRCRNEMVYGLLEYGWNFIGLSVFQALTFLRFCKTLPFVDASRIALSGHSLGTETALPLALICDDVRALVFNDFLCDQRKRYVSITETDANFTGKGSELVHILPGKFRYFTYPDLCASLAPTYLALNEGGAEEDLEKVRRAYDAAGAKDRLLISYYPRYADPASRPHKGEPVPDHGLSPETYFEYTATDAPDHSFRGEPSLALLKRCFALE